MTTQFLDHDHGRIAFTDTGNGPLVICVPSMGDLKEEYRYLSLFLVEAGYRVVCMDARGMGESSTDWSDYSVAGVGSDIVALGRHLDSPKIFIIGESMAAGAAVWAAAEAPELFRGIILAGPFVRGNADWISRILFSTLFARPWGPSLWASYYKRFYPTSAPVDFYEYTRKLQSNLAEKGRVESFVKMMLASKDESEKRLPVVKSPALVLMGSMDPDFREPEVDAKWVADALHGRYILIPSAGHYPVAEMPDLVASHLLNFLGPLSQG
jgi:pimeloyl-ACP methyl ester carboxylesterase